MPTVVLAQQQQQIVIKKGVPVPIWLISGANKPDQWKDHALWSHILTSYRIIVSTPDVLLNMLQHSYVHLGHDISFLVIDKAHHVADCRTYNLMWEFYDDLPPHKALDSANVDVHPMFLGLTVNPIFDRNAEKPLW